jgi:hypothetical protein
VVGAAQIKQFGEIAVDSMIVLNQPLTGPIVYTGEELSIIVGLLSVLSRDYGQALLDTAASLSELVMLDTGGRSQSGSAVPRPTGRCASRALLHQLSRSPSACPLIVILAGPRLTARNYLILHCFLTAPP